MSFIKRFLERRGISTDGIATMSMMEHVEALRWHMVRSLLVIIVAAIFVFINIDFVFDKIIIGPAKSDFISYKWMCYLGELVNIDDFCMNGVDLEFQNTQLVGQFMLSISVSLFTGFIISFPYVFWEFWRFIKPALTDKEIKMASGIVFWSSFLFLFGVVFAYFVVAPFTISFFSNYQLSPNFKNIITIKNYYDTVSQLIIGMGLVFELPIVVYFLSKVGILTPQLMREKRRYAIVIIMLIAAIITPPDWFSVFLVWIPMLLLYEASIMLSARVYKQRLADKEIEEKNEDDEELDW